MPTPIDTGVSSVHDVIELRVPAGGRVLVASDVHLETKATPASSGAATELAQAIEQWVGPGCVVLAGDVVEFLAEDVSDPKPIFDAHPRLVAVLQEFVGEDDRQVVYLLGNHDSRLAWDSTAAERLAQTLGARLGLAAELSIETGQGTRRVRIEHGNRFDPPNAFTDPRDPLDVPLGHHVVRQFLPTLKEPGREWLRGVEELADPVAFPAFAASRLAYRKLARHIKWLLLPFVLALLLKVPLTYVLFSDAGRRVGLAWSHRLLLLGSAVLADVVLVLGALSVAARQAWEAVANAGVQKRGRAQNDSPRAEARALVSEGYAGLITGHTHHAELTLLGGGFYANTGCCSQVVDEAPSRFGLPPVFLSHRQTSWVELEAGADLHVRLLHARRDLPDGTLLERLAARRSRRHDTRPSVVATFPSGPAWPISTDPVLRRRGVRLAAALAIAAAGLINLISALTPPLHERLRWLRHAVPLGVPQAATALVALAGLGLLLLARGVRRGQRRAWTAALLLLVGSGAFHVLKGVDLEESLAALAIALYLLVNRRAFEAATERGAPRRLVLVLTAVTVGAVAVSTAAVELVSGNHRHRLPLGRALAAIAERLVGLTTIPLPRRLNNFLTPALVAVGFGVVLVLGWVLFRPVVRRRHAGKSELARARALLARTGGDTLSYFALRNDKDHFFWGDGFVAYAVLGGVCLVSPDPICPTAERDELWADFHRFADSHGWAVAVMGAGEEWLPTYRKAGMHDVYVGDEAIVDCARFTLEGGRAKALRQAVNRVARYGYRVEFFDPSRLEPELQADLTKLMAESRKGDVERGFSMTLGRVFDPDDKGLLLAVCFGPDSSPVAFCQFVPARSIDGYSLDLMRRSSGEHPNGLTDFVVVETIRYIRNHGMRRLGLNFATMRAVLAGEAGEGIAQRMERWLLQHMSDSMQIESLWKYNAKFDPEWRPRYAVYDAPEHLLPAALAVARAESFTELPLVGRFLAPVDPTSAPSEPAEDELSSAPSRNQP